MNRPDPDALLRRVQAAEPQRPRGRLKVFFGMAPGVGKTYAMLAEARGRRAAGVEVVIGVVETHGRAETRALLDGLDVLPPRQLEHGGVELQEFDLDGALQRHPQLLLVDELAHTNAAGARHAKRWQDVAELLAAGIDVYSTVNVQHLDSLNDVVAQITGVQVRETIPDHILEQADEIELVDLPPLELQARLREGKVYVAQSVERALANFFRAGNLTALRELALRRTAECVDAQMQAYRRDHAVADTWPTTERLLVCLGPHPLGTRLVRAARRMAASLHAEWLVAWVETATPLNEGDAARVQSSLRLAESLGAQTVHLCGEDIAAALLAFARERNVSKIVVGKPARPRWRERLFGSVVDDVVRGSGDIDVYVITGEASGAAESGLPRHLLPVTPLAWLRYLGALGIVTSCTLLAKVLYGHLAPTNLTMLYLAGVVLAATRLGRGPAVLAAVGGVAAFDFFFVPPHLTLAVGDAEYLLTMGVLLGTGLLISNLTARVQAAAQAARDREKRTLVLYSLARDLAAARGAETIVQVALRHVEDFAEASAAIWRTQRGELAATTRETGAAMTSDSREAGVARWAFDHGQRAGAGTDTLPAAQAIYLPLQGAQMVEGVLSVQLRGSDDTTSRLTPLASARLHDLETLASQVALALERARLAETAQSAEVQVETERLRNSLLSAVSHDLRTPLASIVGAAGTLLEPGANYDEATRRDLLQSIAAESDRLHRLVSNLLEMTRLQSGAVPVRKEWQPLEEVVGAALLRFDKDFGARKVTTNLPAELPLVPIDATLMEQVFINLIENALKYSPPTGSLHVAALQGEGVVLVEVSDRGPGIPAGRENDIFNPFFRAGQHAGEHADQSTGGAGLGLAICRAIVEAHGGAIWVENRPRGGAVFRFTIPLEGGPPLVVAPSLEAEHGAAA